MQNPLLDPVQTLLNEHPRGIAEYDILKALEQHPALGDLGTQGQLPLFHKHFLIMNALYQLQEKLWDSQQQVLEITPLLNTLHATAPSASQTQLIQAESRGPSEYYMNWENYHNTSESDVSNLYKSFWSYLAAKDNRPSALDCLGLDPTQEHSEAAIIQRYRQLAKQHHPDTGGDGNTFIEVRAAFETLKKSFKTQ